MPAMLQKIKMKMAQLTPCWTQCEINIFRKYSEFLSSIWRISMENNDGFQVMCLSSCHNTNKLTLWNSTKKTNTEFSNVWKCSQECASGCDTKWMEAPLNIGVSTYMCLSLCVRYQISNSFDHTVVSHFFFFVSQSLIFFPCIRIGHFSREIS